jgi:mono/diheme cytochrome c family protein
MKTNQSKLLIIVGFVVLLLFVISFKSEESLIAADADPAAVYKSKCAVCHTAKAEKFFDLSKTDEQHVETILKGKKGAKPPFMPEFASKGITPEQAKELTVYMRKLRTPEGANTTVNRANANAVGNSNSNATVNRSANVNANANANANVNANSNANANANANANVNANANTLVNVNANVSANSNAAVKKIPDAELAAMYKAKCAMCHSPKAEKSYDPAMPIEEQVAAILKGKKAAKPPNMPGFETKGITAEQAEALAGYMKSLRTPNK